MPKFYGAIDLLQNELQNARVQNAGSAPGAPAVAGQLWYDSANNILKWYNGSTWVAAQGGGALTPAATVTTQAVGDAAVVGTSTNYAREDHKHGREAFGAITPEPTFGSASGNGSAATLARSDHTHGNPVHDDAAHALIHLSALAIPTADLNMNSHKIINLADPTANSDGATKQYVDGLIAGLSWKTTVKVATIANGALATAFANGQSVDGVTLITGDRILLKNQTAGAENGIYTVNASGAPTRATDADSGPELVNAAVYVSQGTTNQDTGWVCTTNAPITIGTTATVWVQFTGAAALTAGAGLTQTANQIDVVAGDTSMVVNADEIHVNTAVITPTTRNLATTLPLTGGGNLTADRTLAINSFAGSAPGAVPVSVGGTTTFLRADGAWAAPPGTGISKFAAGLTGTASPEVVTHNLNTRDVQVTVLNGASPYTAVEVDWDATTVNTITIRYSPNLGAGYRVVVVG